MKLFLVSSNSFQTWMTACLSSNSFPQFPSWMTFYLDDSLPAPTNQLRASRLVQRKLLQLPTRLRTLRLAQKHRRRSSSQARQRRWSTTTTAEHCDDGDDGEHVRGATEADADVDPEPHERQGGRYVSRRVKPAVDPGVLGR